MIDQQVIKRKLHDYINNSDLSGLKDYIDSMQRSLLSFDDPSLLMMAIEVYLDPMAIRNQEFQMEIIVFLSKCGLGYYVPGGNFFLRIYDYCHQHNQEDQAEEKEFELKLRTLLDQLLGYRNPTKSQILTAKLPVLENRTSYQSFWDYLERHQAAYRIQQWWRGNKRITK